MIKHLTTAFFSLLCVACYAQTGGYSTFEFVNLPKSATVSALGGYTISRTGNEMAVGLCNPALYDSTMGKRVSISSGFYPLGIKYGFAGYAQPVKNIGVLALGIQFISYGKFTYYDDAGNTDNSTFTANEYLINAGISRKYDNHFTYGVNVKYIGSRLESYHAYGIGADAGLYYHDTAGLFTAGAVITNMGSVIKTYVPNTQENMPLDVQVAVTKKLSKAPFRFTLLAHHLQEYNIRYTYPYQSQQTSLVLDSTSTSSKPKSYTADIIFRHINIGTEIIFSQNFQLQIGYSHLRRQELGFSVRPGMAGFSFGAMMRIKSITISYSHQVSNVASGNNLLSLNLDWARWFN